MSRARPQSLPQARARREPEVAERLQPRLGAGTMRVWGGSRRPARARGGNPGGLRSRAGNKRRRGAAAEGPTGKLSEAPRPPPRTMAAERAKAGRHAPAPPAGPYLVVLLPAAPRRRRPARAARHVHVQRAGERAPQRPHPPRQPHGRQAQGQPARQQSHRGLRARSDHRRRRGEEQDAPPPSAADTAARARAIEPYLPIQPSQGRGGVGGAGRAQPSRRPCLSSRGTPLPPARVSSRSTNE